jgi:CheY-like chemotaxis protein
VSDKAPFAVVVDDNVVILMMACQILEAAGFRCLEAETGDEAKGILERHDGEITLLLTDVEMPGDLDGLALARFAGARWPEMQIFVASGCTIPGEGEMPAGATFIPKPFTARVMRNHLKQKVPD